MKNLKHNFAIIVCMCLTNFAFSQTISDTNFANAIRNLYPSLIETNNNNLTSAAASYDGVLDFSGWGNATNASGATSAFAAQPKLTTLEGIQNFVQCKGIDVSNQLLTGLPSLPNSVVFFISTNNQLVSLPSALPTALEYLRVSQNSLVQLPALPSGLKALKCDQNQLTQLPTLPNSLAYLDVSFNLTLGCLPTVPHNLVNNSLPTSTLTTYVFSSNPVRRVDFSNTSIRCIPNFYADAWVYDVTLPTAPGGCSQVPTMKTSITGATPSQNNGSITVTATLPSPNGKIEYKLNNGNFQDSNVFAALAAGTYMVYARRKSESSACLNPESSISVTIPIRTNSSKYVSPSGNDINGNGSQNNPYKTITKALSTTFAGSGDTIHLAEGVYVEDSVLTIPSQVSLIGSGSKTTHLRVNVFYNPFDYPTTTETEPLWRDYAIDYDKFCFQIQGGNHTIQGFSIDGQEKKCVGAIYGNFAHNSLFDDIDLQNFRYAAYVLQNADDTTISNNYIKNSTYGTYRNDNACIYIDGYGVLIKKNTIIIDENIGGYGIKNSFPNNTVTFFQAPDLRREKDYFLNIIIEENTILVNSMGRWNNFQAPAFTFENFQTCENCVIRNNILNNVLSLIDSGKHSNGYFYSGPRYNIHNNTFNLDNSGYTVEAWAPNIEFHHNYVVGGSGLISYEPLTALSNYDGINYHHNVFYNMRGGLTGWGFPPLNFKFNNNSIIDFKGTAISLGSNSLNRNMEVKNNIFANIDPSITTTPTNNLANLASTNSVISNNLFYNIPAYGSNSIVANPQLLESGIKPYTYFQLKNGSPAIDAGLIIPGTTDGFKGSAPDLGAYEYGSNRVFNNSSSNSLGVGTTNPDSSAVIDILSNSQGILIPRIPLLNIQSMPSPAEGLFVFCSDCLPSVFYYCDGNNWLKHQGGVVMGAINLETSTSNSSVSLGTTTPNKSAVFELSDSSRGLLLPRLNSLDAIVNPTEGLLIYLKNDIEKGIYFYNGKAWQKAINGEIAFSINSNPNTFIGGGNIGINTPTPHYSSIFEINSTRKGLLPPRLNKISMEGIKSPALGLMVYCYDCEEKGFYFNNGTHWQNTAVNTPSVPQNVKATPNGNAATVTFSAPISDGGSPITSYTIISKPGNVTITTINTTALFSNLLSNVAYVFLVSANNRAGASATIATNPIIVGVPDAPTNAFAIRGIAAGAAEVHFTPPAYTGSSPITNYTVTQMPTNTSFTTTQSPFIVTGLNINTTYTFTIKANNNIGASLPSVTNAITASTVINTSPKILDALTATPAVAYGLRQLKSSYTGPAIDVRRASDNQIMAIGFDNEGNLNTGLLINFCGTSMGYVNRWYDQSGQGRDAVNTNNQGQPIIFNGLSIETVLGKPAVKFTGSSIFLRTTQNVFSNSNEITTFTTAYAPYYSDIIQHGNGSGQGHFLLRRQFANFEFRVNSNGIGESVFIDGSTFSLLRTFTFRNSITDARRHLRVNGNNSGSTNNVITANFTNDRLTIGQGFTGHIGEHIEYNSYVPLSSVEQVENNQSHYFSITQPCLANSVPPTAPTQLFASSLSSTQASVSFTPSTSSGSRDMNYYEVTSTPGNIKATGTTSPITLHGLTAGVTYNFEVKAVNYCDETASGTSNTIVLGQISAPSNVSAQKGIAEGTATIAFTPSTFKNNQTITGYTVTSFPDAIQATGNASPITVTGLSDEKKYTFTVVAHTATTTSLPSLASNIIYTHTQILNDLPTPKAAFGLRRLLSAYTGPAVTIRRNDNTTQDIGFLPNGELDEAALLTFVGSGNGFVTKWYDQSIEAKHAINSNTGDQPLLVSNGVVCKHQGQPTIRFYSSDRVNVPALTNVRVVHSIFSMGDTTSGGTDTTSLNFGSLLGQSFTSSFGGNGLDHDWQNSLPNRLRWSGTFYETATLYVNGIDKTNMANNYGPNIIEYKSLIASVNNNVNASFGINGMRAIGSNYSNLSTFLFFGQNLSSTDRQKLDKRQSACFELGF